MSELLSISTRDLYQGRDGCDVAGYVMVAWGTHDLTSELLMLTPLIAVMPHVLPQVPVHPPNPE
jgi:hypothetical protein